MHIRALKQALIHRLILKKAHKVIQFNQELWLKLYINMNTKLRANAKNDFEKDFFQTMENVRKDKDIKLVTTDKKEVN